MTHIKLFLLRHSKSCSNYTRSDEPDPNVAISKCIRDPNLSSIGSRAARRYSPLLLSLLNRHGFKPDDALICASTLRRAQNTATLIFGKKPIIVPNFAENGAIPENTPEGNAYTAPSWSRFIAYLSKLVKEGDSVAVIGHGSYLKSLWPRLTGSSRAKRLNNLDGILLDADISSRGLRVHSFKEILYKGPSMMSGPDKCTIADIHKIAVIRKEMTRKHRSQQGGNGSMGMPLAYFQDGAQMSGRFGEPTGVGLAGLTNSMIRAPLQQTGGFSAAVMGSFAANGSKLMPLAGYMGYKMYSNQKKTIKKRHRKGRKTRRRH